MLPRPSNATAQLQCQKHLIQPFWLCAGSLQTQPSGIPHMMIRRQVPFRALELHLSQGQCTGGGKLCASSQAPQSSGLQ